MSKRSDRRAAERAAHKTNRTQTLTAAQPLSTHAAAASAASPTQRRRLPRSDPSRFRPN